MSDQLAKEVGERVRRLRLDSGLGLRELAKEIGISPSALSALENNRRGMSLSRLQLVAAHFGLKLTELLATGQPDPAGETPRVEVFPAASARTPSVQRGSAASYQLLGRPGGHRLQPALLTFPPGASYERDPIGHAGEEFAYVVLGEIDLLIDDDVHRLGQGDAVRFHSEPVHAFRNASEHGMAFVMTVSTPPW